MRKHNYLGWGFLKQLTNINNLYSLSFCLILFSFGPQ